MVKIALSEIELVSVIELPRKLKVIRRVFKNQDQGGTGKQNHIHFLANHGVS